jgi:hypothetical protein
MLRRTDVRVLLAAAAWTVFVWGNRILNILRDDEDRSTGFVVVHVVLALVSIAFAVAIARIALRARRTAVRGPAGEPTVPPADRERV